MRPAQVDDEEEGKISLQKAEETAQIQDYYDNKYFNRAHPRARVPREIEEGKRVEESNNAFKIERPNYCKIPLCCNTL